MGSVLSLKFRRIDGKAKTQGDKGVVPRGARALDPGQLQSGLKNCSDNDNPSARCVSAGASDDTPEQDQVKDFNALLPEIKELWKKTAQLEADFKKLKTNTQDLGVITGELEDQRRRYDILEEHIKDLTELHENEILILKDELADMEGMFVYQFQERAADILEELHTHISKLELQQQMHLESATGGGVCRKLVNMMLAVLIVLLEFVLISVIFLTKTPSCIFSTLLFVILISILLRYWDMV
nr:PREDICTED: transmembrane and coiled-coil domains protein 1-like [Paralichthys olivaceus]